MRIHVATDEGGTGNEDEATPGNSAGNQLDRYHLNVPLFPPLPPSVSLSPLTPLSPPRPLIVAVFLVCPARLAYCTLHWEDKGEELIRSMTQRFDQTHELFYFLSFIINFYIFYLNFLSVTSSIFLRFVVISFSLFYFMYLFIYLFTVSVFPLPSQRCSFEK